MESFQIKKVDRGTALADELLCFVEHFSWLEVREHTVRVIQNWEFEDWEAPFAAVLDGQVVGMVTLMRSDYYPLPEVFPWVSTLFVSEPCRGKGLAGRLIAAANEYAAALGFQQTYIPTEYTGLYERYGYGYLRDITNYGGGVDRLYVRKLD